jgi:hypothetical protein
MMSQLATTVFTARRGQRGKNLGCSNALMPAPGFGALDARDFKYQFKSDPNQKIHLPRPYNSPISKFLLSQA